eukprot:2132066-Rhodomonas_salina.1
MSGTEAGAQGKGFAVDVSSAPARAQGRYLGAGTDRGHKPATWAQVPYPATTCPRMVLLEDTARSAPTVFPPPPRNQIQDSTFWCKLSCTGCSNLPSVVSAMQCPVPT